MEGEENTPEILHDNGNAGYEVVEEDKRDDRVPENVSEDTPEELTPEQIASAPSMQDGEDFDAPFDDKRNWKKIVFIIGIAFIIILVFVGIYVAMRGGRSSSKNKKNVTLVYWGLWEDKKIFEPLIRSKR